MAFIAALLCLVGTGLGWVPAAAAAAVCLAIEQLHLAGTLFAICSWHTKPANSHVPVRARGAGHEVWPSVRAISWSVIEGWVGGREEPARFQLNNAAS